MSRSSFSAGRIASTTHKPAVHDKCRGGIGSPGPLCDKRESCALHKRLMTELAFTGAIGPVLVRPWVGSNPCHYYVSADGEHR